MKIVRTGCLIFSVFCCSSIYADIDSGPKVGATVAPLKVTVMTGDQSGKDLDIAAERGNKPTVYLFVQHERFDRPLARLFRVLEKGTEDAGSDAGMVTVYLTDDEAKAKLHLPRIQSSLKFKINSLVIHPSATSGPEGWAVNTDAYLTVVIVNDGKISATFGYRSANETVAPEIISALKNSIKK
jgi:hypothetical protein